MTNTTHEWPTVDAFVDEVREARILGGMHFRHSAIAGEKIGVEVARHVAAHPMWQLDDVRYEWRRAPPYHPSHE